MMFTKARFVRKGTILKTGAAVAAMLAAAACATAYSDYGPARSPRDYGYYDTRIEPDRYRVVYRARGDDVGAAQDYALLRASELTLQSRYDWFRVLDSSTNVVSDADPSYGTTLRRDQVITRECGLLGCRTSARPTYTYGNELGTYDIDNDTVVAIEIIMGSGPIPRGVRGYDARRIDDEIRRRRY